MPYKPEVIRFDYAAPSLGGVDWRGGVVLRSTNWLGDILMTLPATWQLRRVLPKGVPLWAAAPAGLAPLWTAAPWIDGVIPFSGKRMASDERNILREKDFGFGVVLPNSFGSALDFYRAGIPRRLGRRGNFRGWMLTDAIPQWHRHEGEGKWHQLSWYLDLMRPFGAIDFTADSPSLRVDGAYAESLGIRRGAGFVALAPGAAYGPAKQWPSENFIRVAEALLKRGRRIVLVGARSEAGITSEIASSASGCLDLGGRTTLPELMSVLANVDAAVANDSGAMHLAAALGTRGVGIFASTDPVATGPLGAPWELRIADVDCRPCLQRECPWAGYRKYKCMRALPPEGVIESLDALLGA